MPSFNGSPIFGRSVSMVTTPNQPASQRNSFFGIHGVESLGGGRRGYTTTALGLLVGDSPEELGGAQGNFMILMDGTVYPFVDNFGRLWSETSLDNFRPIGKIFGDDKYPFCQLYEAQLFSLLAPGEGNDGTL